MKSSKRRIKTSILVAVVIMIIQIITLSVFEAVAEDKLVTSVKNSTIDSLNTALSDRSVILENYITEAEAYLTAYSRAGEISALLKDPTNAKLAADAQKYTEKFSADREYLEGIYASEWDTHVLTHTTAAVVGITTRTGDGLKALQDAMLAADGVYNTGIIISPASGQQIISMYQAVLDDKGNPIGLVGGGIFTTGIKQLLAELPTYGLDTLKYYLINTESKQFIFHENEELVGTEVEDAVLLEMLDSTETYLETDELFVAKKQLENKGWTFILTADSEEVFAETNDSKLALKIVSAFSLLFLVVATFLLITYIMQPLNKLNKKLVAMSEGDVKDDGILDKYINSPTDLGKIAEATKKLEDSLRELVVSIDNCSVDLNGKALSLKSNSEQLVEYVLENTAITEELTASFENVSNSTIDINRSVENIKAAIDTTISVIDESTNASNSMMLSANEMKEDANTSLSENKQKISDVKEDVAKALESLSCLSKIDEMANIIMGITEQTNLLSLNASIEAARAGDAGRGFAVVANEIKNLADSSKGTVKSIQEICAEARESVKTVNNCLTDMISFIEMDVLKSFESFSERSGQYADSVNTIQNSINVVNTCVEDLNSAVELIATNLNSVVIATQENEKVIYDISSRNEQTAVIAEKTSNQAFENDNLATELNTTIKKFKM